MQFLTMRIFERVLLATVVAALMCGGMRARAQEDHGYWRMASTNAKTVTGDIDIAELKVTIDFLTFPIAQIRRLKPVEVSAVFDADLSAGIQGTLYRLNISPGQRFLHKNTLCGGEATQWMATYSTGKTLNVAFFSGDDIPVFAFDAMQNASNLCGNYVYSR